MILRPYGIVLSDGHLELGIEVLIEEGRILEIRPHTGIPEPYVVSAAFVNCHSHLEYRGLQGRVMADGYWPWIREITRLKLEQSLPGVRGDAMLAAEENRLTGVALVGEHSDRPLAAEAMAMAGLGGIIFQELITFLEQEDSREKQRQVEERAREQALVSRGPVYLSPHTAFTVDEASLRRFASGDPFSIHVAESLAETEFFQAGSGPIGEMYRANGFQVIPRGVSPVVYLNELGLVRRGAQFVHCSDVSDSDIALMASNGVTVAHCPRSNIALGCPDAPVREMIDAGIPVGLGLDSAASSGPIDMFSEMRSALQVSEGRHEPLKPEEVWRMATGWGASSLWKEGWEIEEGSGTPLIKIFLAGAHSTEELMERGAPELVEWVNA